MSRLLDAPLPPLKKGTLIGFAYQVANSARYIGRPPTAEAHLQIKFRFPAVNSAADRFPLLDISETQKSGWAVLKLECSPGLLLFAVRRRIVYNTKTLDPG
jgi:hypothetical protein